MRTARHCFVIKEMGGGHLLVLRNKDLKVALTVWTKQRKACSWTSRFEFVFPLSHHKKFTVIILCTRKKCDFETNKPTTLICISVEEAQYTNTCILCVCACVSVISMQSYLLNWVWWVWHFGHFAHCWSDHRWKPSHWPLSHSPAPPDSPQELALLPGLCSAAALPQCWKAAQRDNEQFKHTKITAVDTWYCSVHY